MRYVKFYITLTLDRQSITFIAKTSYQTSTKDINRKKNNIGGIKDTDG